MFEWQMHDQYVLCTVIMMKRRNIHKKKKKKVGGGGRLLASADNCRVVCSHGCRLNRV